MEQFGKYRLLERLGSGGMAEVWRAEVDYASGVSKIVALKMIREDLVKVPQFVSLFIDEARITSRISHANVAQVFDFGEVERRPFLAMELVDGPDLETVAVAARESKTELPLSFCAHVVAEVARGLAAAHGLADDTGRSYGVVHRDVSPQNVLISRAGEIKLTDFGIARARDKVTQTETGTVMGKFRYMSPEQVLGQDLDARSDLFSCGILLFELITGTRLFNGRTSAEVVDQIRYQAIPDITRHRPDVDPALDTVMRWTLERNPAKRCPDAATLARDLERYIHVAHPRFTRDAISRVLDELVPRQAARKSRLAFAGTERVSVDATEPPPDKERSRTLPGATPAAPVDTAGPLDTTAPGKRRPAPEPRGAPETSRPAEEEGTPGTPMQAAETEAFDGSLGVGSPPTASATAPEPDASSRTAKRRQDTETLVKREVRSATPPAPQEVSDDGLADRLTEALTRDVDETAPTRAARTDESAEIALAETRTAGRKRSRDGGPRRPRRAFGPVLGVLVAAAALAGVAWFLLRPGAGSGNRTAPASPASNPENDSGVHAALQDDATARDGGAGDAAVRRVADLDAKLAQLPILRGPRAEAVLRMLAERVAERLTRATVDDAGNRHLAPPAPLRDPALRKHPLHDTALSAADVLAERILWSGEVPPAGKALLLPPPKPLPEDPCALRKTNPGSALYVLAHPDRAGAMARHVVSQGCRKAWAKPLAGAQGQRYLWPHLAVARDAVARLLELAPRNPLGRMLKRYLDATPRGRSAALGELTVTLKSVTRRALKKSDRQAVAITLRLANGAGAPAVRIQPSTFRLYGAGDHPLPPSLWQPELTAPLTPGAAVSLTLTFAAPAGQRGFAWVLAVPRAQAGALWLQAESDLVP